MDYIKDPAQLKTMDPDEARQLIGKLGTILAVCIFLLIPAFAVYYLVDVKLVGTYGNALPIARVDGNSMLPMYTPGEWVTYYTPDKKPIEPGSVIIYTKALAKIPVIHRVVTIWPDGTMTTKGDNNAGTDQELLINSRNVTMQDVVGVVGGPIHFSFIDDYLQYVNFLIEIIMMGC